MQFPLLCARDFPVREQLFRMHNFPARIPVKRDVSRARLLLVHPACNFPCEAFRMGMPSSSEIVDTGLNIPFPNPGFAFLYYHEFTVTL